MSGNKAKTQKQKKGQKSSNSWDNLPSDLLLLIFKYLPMSTLTVCLYVSRTWRNHLEYVFEVKNMWKELCETNFNVSEFKIKCNKKIFGLPRMYYNYMKWLRFQQATLKLHQIREINGINKIYVYRDNLTVMNDEILQQYDAKTFRLKPTGLELSSCTEYFENDDMAVKAYKDNKLFKLVLYVKNGTNDFMTESNAVTAEDVICYKVHNEECHAMDRRDVYTVYTVVSKGDNKEWLKDVNSRYYGLPSESRAINVFDKQVYVLLNDGFILWMDKEKGVFRKISVFVCETTKDIYRHTYVKCCVQNSLGVCSRTVEVEKENRKSDRSSRSLSRSPSNESIMLPYIVRNVTSMHQHGEILFLGYFDGTVELISSRDISRNPSLAKPLRRFNIKDFKDDLTDVAIISMDVSEDEVIQHMYIATKTQIFHLHVTYKHLDGNFEENEANSN